MVVFRSREKAEFDEHWAKIMADDACLKKTIVADGQIAGHIGSFGRDGKREVGYWIDRTPFGGKALWAERCPPFFASNKRGRSTPVWPGPDVASIRVLQKCGFHLMPERDRSGTRARRQNRIFFSALQRRKVQQQYYAIRDSRIALNSDDEHQALYPRMAFSIAVKHEATWCSSILSPLLRCFLGNM